MKKIIHIIYIITLLVFFQTKDSYSQRIVQGINPMRGRSVDFMFRSVKDISQGKSLGNSGVGYTEIYVYFDTIGTGGTMFLPEVTGWELIVYSNTTTLVADFGSADLALDKVRLFYDMPIGTGIIPTPNAILSSNPGNVIASGLIGDGVNGGVEWTVTLYYECAKDGTDGLIGVDSDLYYTDLIFFIRPVYA